MKDRRWRLTSGQESEYGRMSIAEVEKIKACNIAFWELYINKRPPQDILNKKRKQYARKTENNKSYRSSKKPKAEGQDDDEKGKEHDQNAHQEDVDTSIVPDPFPTEYAAPDGLVVAAPEGDAADDTGNVYSV